MASIVGAKLSRINLMTQLERQSVAGLTYRLVYIGEWSLHISCSLANPVGDRGDHVSGQLVG